VSAASDAGAGGSPTAHLFGRLVPVGRPCRLPRNGSWASAPRAAACSAALRWTAPPPRGCRADGGGGNGDGGGGDRAVPPHRAGAEPAAVGKRRQCPGLRATVCSDVAAPRALCPMPCGDPCPRAACAVGGASALGVGGQRRRAPLHVKQPAGAHPAGGGARAWDEESARAGCSSGIARVCFLARRNGRGVSPPASPRELEPPKAPIPLAGCWPIKRGRCGRLAAAGAGVPHHVARRRLQPLTGRTMGDRLSPSSPPRSRRGRAPPPPPRATAADA